MSRTEYTVIAGARPKHPTSFDSDGHVIRRTRRTVDCDHVAAAVRLHGLDITPGGHVVRGVRNRWQVPGVTPAHTVTSGSCGDIWIDRVPYHLALYAETRAA